MDPWVLELLDPSELQLVTGTWVAEFCCYSRQIKLSLGFYTWSLCFDAIKFDARCCYGPPAPVKLLGRSWTKLELSLPSEDWTLSLSFFGLNTFLVFNDFIILLAMCAFILVWSSFCFAGTLTLFPGYFMLQLVYLPYDPAFTVGLFVWRFSITKAYM